MTATASRSSVEKWLKRDASQTSLFGTAPPPPWPLAGRLRRFTWFDIAHSSQRRDLIWRLAYLEAHPRDLNSVCENEWRENVLDEWSRNRRYRQSRKIDRRELDEKIRYNSGKSLSRGEECRSSLSWKIFKVSSAKAKRSRELTFEVINNYWNLLIPTFAWNRAFVEKNYSRELFILDTHCLFRLKKPFYKIDRIKLFILSNNRWYFFN